MTDLVTTQASMYDRIGGGPALREAVDPEPSSGPKGQ